MIRLPAGRDAIERYFAGPWSLSRKIIDRRGALRGHLIGAAHFQESPSGFDYEETGEMIYGAYQGRASQSYRWDFETADRLIIRFRDGRLFHELDLSGGTAAVEHLCAADLYRGRFRLISDDCWLSRWLIVGPRKDQIILNRYRKRGSTPI